MRKSSREICECVLRAIAWLPLAIISVLEGRGGKEVLISKSNSVAALWRSHKTKKSFLKKEINFYSLRLLRLLCQRFRWRDKEMRFFGSLLGAFSFWSGWPAFAFAACKILFGRFLGNSVVHFEAVIGIDIDEAQVVAAAEEAADAPLDLASATKDLNVGEVP